jgi:LytR cell envelope-related transcriptional attenuator
MTDLIDRIGPFLGIAAFLGLAFLAFLVIQQAREVRRLREWAGRAPERASDASEASAAAAEARGEVVEEDDAEEAPPSRAALWMQARRQGFADQFAELDRRLPVDPRFLIALVAAAVIAAAILTSGFGLVGGSDSGGTAKSGGKHGGGKSAQEKVEVAILNATQVQDTVTGQPIQGVPGLADKVAKNVVKPAGFKVGAKTNASSGFDQTQIMFEPGHETEASDLASKVTDQLGQTEVVPMIGEVRALAGGAPLALVIGADDANFGS